MRHFLKKGEYIKTFERDWTDRAACRAQPLEIFFPWMTPRVRESMETTLKRQKKNAAKALAICALCPVIEECKHDHLHELDGIFFGTVPIQRHSRKYYDWRKCECLACGYRRAKGMRGVHYER